MNVNEIIDMMLGWGVGGIEVVGAHSCSNLHQKAVKHKRNGIRLGVICEKGKLCHCVTINHV